MTLPPDVQRVINARADDALQAILAAAEKGDRQALNRAAWDLVWTLEDEAAAQREAGL